MKVKAGDIIEFFALDWQEAQWDFDFPSVLLEPVIQYSPNGVHGDAMIEDICIDLISNIKCEDENVEEEFTWRGWKIDRMKKVVKSRLNGKDVWKSRGARAYYQRVHFYAEKDGGLNFKILETVEK